MNIWGRIVIGLSILTLAVSACVTPGPTVKEVGSLMEARLNHAMKLDMTKAEMLEQAGPPTEKAPLDNGGELWVYSYTSQKTYNIPDQVMSVGKRTYNLGGGKTETRDYAMRVNIKFNRAGEMIGWGYNGNLAVFPENPFTKLTPPVRSSPKVSSAAIPSIEIQKKHLSETFNSLLRAGNVAQRHILLQAGIPQEMPEPEGKEFDTSFKYRYSRPADANGGPYRLDISIRFNDESRMTGWSADGHFGLLATTPFDKFQLPDPGDTGGQWAFDASTRVKAIFDAIPAGYSVRWEGGSVPMPNRERLADGKGIMRIADQSGKELGAYVGLFRAGVPVGEVRLIKADPASPPVEGLKLGGSPWN